MEEERISLERAKCDKYDYIIAACSGVLAGLVDVFLVGSPGSSVLQGTVDKGADELVKKSAQLFYKFDKRTVGKPKKMPNTLEKCISYLEQAFPVPYDARYAKDLKVGGDVLSGMRPANHHLMSLGHSPDFIGLIFSIIDQFTDMASFIDNGTVIRVVPEKTSGAVPYMQGSSVISKLFCGFVNWIGHLLSDLVGSSSTRVPEKNSRGSGIQMPFYELLLLCVPQNGDVDGESIANVAIKAFEEGYDARFAATMSIPVVLSDLFIRFTWAFKSHFYGKKPWKKCIPTNKNDDLRVMILVGTSALCVVDGIGAGAKSGGTWVGFVLNLNLVAWAKLAMLALKELVIRYNYALDDIVVPYRMLRRQLEEYILELEAIDIDLFKEETAKYNEFCDGVFEAKTDEEINIILEATYREIGIELPYTGDFDSFMGNKDNHLKFS